MARRASESVVVVIVFCGSPGSGSRRRAYADHDLAAELVGFRPAGRRMYARRSGCGARDAKGGRRSRRVESAANFLEFFEPNLGPAQDGDRLDLRFVALLERARYRCARRFDLTADSLAVTRMYSRSRSLGSSPSMTGV